MAGLIHPDYKAGVLLGAATSIAAAGALFSRYEAAKIVGLTVLTAVGTVFINNLLGYRDCPDYFVRGEKSADNHQDNRLVRHPSSVLQAGVWALEFPNLRLWLVCTLFAAAARLPFQKFSHQISAQQLAPWMVASNVVILVLAHWTARALENKGVVKKNHWKAVRARDEVAIIGAKLFTALLLIGIIAKRATFKSP